MAENNAELLPAYLSFPTFQSAINNLRAHGLPPKLDRSAWSSRSGAEQGQIISGFKFLGLIDNDGKTQVALRQLVDQPEASDQERQALAKILLDRYADIFSTVHLETATPKQLIDAIGSYGTSGATKKRAVRFFLKAAEHARLPLSTRLTAGMRSRKPSSLSNGNDGEENAAPLAGRARRRRTRGVISTDPPERQDDNGTGSAVKTVALREAGGRLTLSGTFNPFELDGDDRKLVYDIIDLMKKYEKAMPSSKETGA